MPEPPDAGMRRPNFWTVLGCWLLATLAMSGAQAAETILDFHSDIQVQRNADVVVEETIRVRAEGNKIRRGIYRDIPTDYKDRYGNRYRVGLEVLAVRRDGRTEPYHTERRANGLRIYIGEESVRLRPGDYEYRLRYRTDRQLGFFADHDELYWNVTGNAWDFPIAQASARVRLPAGVPMVDVHAEAYTGRSGAKGQDYEAWIDPDGAAEYRTTRRLQPREGLTIVAAWPKGYVDQPSREQQLDYFLTDNREALLGAGGLLALLLYYWASWLRVGRDPPAGVIFPRYEPPRDYSPAALRYVRRMGYDHKTFATAVVNLAVKGYLRIEESSKDVFALEKTGDRMQGRAAPGEGAIASALFGSGTHRITLARSNHAQLAKALKAHRRALQVALEKSHFLHNAVYLVPGIVISVALLVAVILALPDGQQRSLSAFMCVWLSGWTIGVAAVVHRAVTAWRAPHGVLSGAFATLFALPFVAGEVFGIWILATQGSPAVVAVILGVVGINYAFYHWLKAPTLRGRELLDEIEGFRLYLSVAEQEELNFKHPPEKTPALFERYLPYALALDVEQEWSARFSDVLARAGADGTTYRPGWYHGSSLHSHNFAGLATAVGGGLGSAIASASTPPGSSSGGGGGGSSGGGGGGGGGGGW